MHSMCDAPAISPLVTASELHIAVFEAISPLVTASELHIAIFDLVVRYSHISASNLQGLDQAAECRRRLLQFVFG